MHAGLGLLVIVFCLSACAGATEAPPVSPSAAFAVAASTSDCHPSYSGKCVPIASDVDCAGGQGNGPAYVQGPVRVIGPDVYELDRDGDGIACEPFK